MEKSSSGSPPFSGPRGSKNERVPAGGGARVHAVVAVVAAATRVDEVRGERAGLRGAVGVAKAVAVGVRVEGRGHPLVHRPIAVVVDLLADLLGGRVDVGVVVVTILVCEEAVTVGAGGVGGAILVAAGRGEGEGGHRQQDAKCRVHTDLLPLQIDPESPGAVFQTSYISPWEAAAIPRG